MINKVRVNTMLPVDLLEKLDKHAFDMGLNRTSMLTVIINQYLEQQQS